MMNRWHFSFAAACLVFAPTSASAQAPALLPVQGVLTDADGTALDGPFQVTFTLYDTASGDTSFFAETKTVNIEAGVFTTYLGTDGSNPLDLVNFQMSDAYLGIQVAGNEEMTPRFRLATAPYAGFAQYCGDASTLGGQTSADFAPASHTHPWSDITDVPGFASLVHGHAWNELSGVPSDLADGDDNTLYSAGTGLNASGTVFSVDDSYVQRRVNQTCSNGGISQINADGSTVCDTDDDTTYQAGTGLSLSGSRFSVDQYANLARKGRGGRQPGLRHGNAGARLCQQLCWGQSAIAEHPARRRGRYRVHRQRAPEQ